MKTFLITFFVLLFVSSVACAKTANFSWGYDPAAESTIDGYKIYQLIENGTDKQEVWTTDDPSLRTGGFELTGDFTECRTYFIVAYKANVPSDPSNTAAACPDIVLPPVIVKPGTTINFTVNVID